MKTLFSALLIVVSIHAAAQQESFRNDYYNKKRALHESIPKVNKAIVMLGNSLTEQGQWGEYFPGKDVLNRGIGGDIIAGMIDRLPDVLKNKPSKIFITAGINDILFFDITRKQFEEGYNKIFEIIQQHQPKCEIYLESLLPVNETVKPDSKFLADKNGKINMYNELIKDIAKKHHVKYINIHDHMLNGTSLSEAFTTDGIHLNERGYLVWTSLLKPFIYE